ncbi:hypothetical protein C8R43DRAFT_1002431 [Mycena crocata]|nr:hypothetical protein C8R43DRAFT_1002431 [Mycena crocata]
MFKFTHYDNLRILCLLILSLQLDPRLLSAKRLALRSATGSRVPGDRSLRMKAHPCLQTRHTMATPSTSGARLGHRPHAPCLALLPRTVII